MKEIKEFDVEHLDEYVKLAYNSYPSFKDYSDEGIVDFKRLIKIRMNDPKSKFYGMFEDNKLIAAMRLFDFEMNYFNTIVPASGLASLAVDLLHKKERIAKTMIDFYEDLYIKKQVPFALLLPFTPEFYKNMGYGLGSKMNQYRIKSDRLPSCFDKADIRYINKDNLNEILDCHNRYLKQTHGMLSKIDEEIVEFKENKNNIIVANYNENQVVDGYLIFEFLNGKEDNYTINNLYIKEFIYENPTSLKRLLGFLKKQADQVNTVILNTQNEYFAQLIDNPLNDTLNYIPFGNLETNTQAIGVMYKILDIEKVFSLYQHRNFNNLNLNIKFIISDENKVDNEIIINFKDGIANMIVDDYDLSIKLSLVDFSSLMIGSISIDALYNLGLLEIDNIEYLNLLDLAFYCKQKPICNTDF